MKLFSEFLSEGRDAPLYHGTTAANAVAILQSNILKPHLDKYDTRDKRPFVAFSRSAQHSAQFVRQIIDKFPVVLEFNQAKLSQRYTIKPIADSPSYDEFEGLFTSKERKKLAHRKTPMFRKIGGLNEFEERIYSEVHPVSKYLTEIKVLKEDYNKLPEYLKQHPLLTVYSSLKDLRPAA